MRNRKKIANTGIFRIKLDASTLVEVLVAVAVCMLIFSISMTIILKVDRENSLHQKLTADLIHQQLKEELQHETLKQTEDTLTISGLTICLNIEPVDSIAGVWEISNRIYSRNGTPLSVKRYFVYSNTVADE